MKLRKMLALALSCLLVLSLFAACGGEEDYEEEPETEAVQELEEAELPEVGAEIAPEDLASDESWEILMANAGVFGEYNAVLKTMDPEQADPGLIAYVEEINPRVMEVAALTRENTTEEMAVSVNEEILEWIDGLAQYIELPQ